VGGFGRAESCAIVTDRKVLGFFICRASAAAAAETVAQAVFWAEAKCQDPADRY